MPVSIALHLLKDIKFINNCIFNLNCLCSSYALTIIINDNFLIIVLDFSDPNLCKILIKCYNEKHTEDIESTSMDEKNLSNAVSNNEVQQNQPTKIEAPDISADECLLCSEQKRDTVFKPCGHIVSCEACGSRIKKCLICRETVSSREKVRMKVGPVKGRNTKTLANSFSKLLTDFFKNLPD